MSNISVIGGTGYAGHAIVAEAAARGHSVTSLSRTAPAAPIAQVDYRYGDASDRATLAAAIAGADIVVAALAPRGDFHAVYRPAYRAIAELAGAEKARLFVVGGYSSLRPAAGADRFISDLSGIPEALHAEIRAGANVVLEDLPATPSALNWIFVSPALRFGAHFPGEATGAYRLGDDVAVQPDDGGAISAVDYALGLVDLFDNHDLYRAHVNLG